MRLSKLIKKAVPEGKRAGGQGDPSITSIHYSSLDVVPGGLFVAVRGFSSDGHDYIEDAVKRGAAGILAEKTLASGPAGPEGAGKLDATGGAEGAGGTEDAAGSTGKSTVPVFTTGDTRTALARVACEFYGHPTEKLFLIGITGTNGKTTTTYLLEEILKAAGIKVGVIGTINWRYGDKVFPNPRTTPESPDLQQIFARMAKEGVTHVVMEVSSHAIDLCRVHGCCFDVGLFTNLTQDHLDFHTGMEEYWACKKRFFTGILQENPAATAVINNDDPRGAELLEIMGNLAVATGTSAGATVNCMDAEFDISGIRGTISTPSTSLPFTTTAVGRFNLENILGAVGVGYVMGLGYPDILKGIERFHVPGRLERVDNEKGINVFVDYAHTPDALESVITTLSEHKTGRLITVFGCGGDRDRGKRAPMGRIAWEGSDLAVVTSDNPRTEEPAGIIEDILGGIGPGASAFEPADLINGVTSKGYIVEPSRREAILLAINTARKGDTVLIAGKGHENYQVIGKETIHFDDREEAIHALDKQ